MCLAGWKHHVDVRLISHLSITRDWCDANDGADWCKARRHGNSLLLQRHPVVVWCLWRPSVRGDVTSCERGISLQSGHYLPQWCQYVTTHTGGYSWRSMLAIKAYYFYEWLIALTSCHKWRFWPFKGYVYKKDSKVCTSHDVSHKVTFLILNLIKLIFFRFLFNKKYWKKTGLETKLKLWLHLQSMATQLQPK